MSKAQFKEMNRPLKAAIQKHYIKKKALKAAMKRREKEQINKICTKINQAIAAEAKDNGYHYVLRENSLGCMGGGRR
jgi:Skp family chaperone for outer membrane proteins